jgi:23S rRNA pseudouridine2605 synthase
MAEDETARIAKVLARAGIASRRDAEVMIAEGRVSVNGKQVDTPALTVGPADRIAVDGRELPPPEPARMWRYHKPEGLVTSARDEQGRPTVFDRLPEGMPRVMSVGRLDIASEGLLLLTNDGEVKRRLELPSTGWLRRYRVRVHGTPSDPMLQPLRDGITLDGERFQPMDVRLDRQQGANAWLTVGIREGRNREVRRAMEAVGLVVNRLIRTGYGPFQLGDLAPGAVEEIPARILREQLGLDRPDRPAVAGSDKGARPGGKPSGRTAPRSGTAEAPRGRREEDAARPPRSRAGQGPAGPAGRRQDSDTRPPRARPVEATGKRPPRGGEEAGGRPPRARGEGAGARPPRSGEGGGRPPRFRGEDGGYPPRLRGGEDSGRPPRGADRKDRPAGGAGSRTETGERRPPRPRPVPMGADRAPGERTFGDRARPDRLKSDRPKSDRPKSDRPKSDRPKSDRPKSDRPKSDRPKSDRPKSDWSRPERPRAEAAGADRPKPDRKRSERPYSDRPGADRARPDRATADRPKTDRPKPDRPKPAREAAPAAPRPALGPGPGYFRPPPRALPAHAAPVARDADAAADPSQPLLGRRRSSGPKGPRGPGAPGKAGGKPAGKAGGGPGGKPGTRPPRGR